MVKKLFKHEFKAWFRVLGIIMGIVLAMAIMCHVIQLVDSDDISYNILAASSIGMSVIAMVVCMAAPTVFGVTRFYQNLFTGEGYLSFTLPVSTADHLHVKLVTAVAFSLLSTLVAAVTSMLIFSGNIFDEFWDLFIYVWEEEVIFDIPAELPGHVIFYLIEMLLLMFSGVIGTYLLYYACICIGQTFRKNRILGAVGVYFAYGMLTQMLGTIFSIGLVLLEDTALMDSYYSFLENHTYAASHISLCSSIVWNLIQAAVFYVICRKIMSSKLNLE